MIVVGAFLPAINEVLEAFPAVVLRHFRVASFGMQLVMWTTLGSVFSGSIRLRSHPQSRKFPLGKRTGWRPQSHQVSSRPVDSRLKDEDASSIGVAS